MGRGRRYDGEPKLNIKKVIAAVIVLIVIIMIIVMIIKLPQGVKKKAEAKNVSNSYLTVYTDGKWGVINSKGDTVITPSFDDMIVIPDNTKSIFICQSGVDLNSEKYTSYAVDNNMNRLFTNYDNIEAMQNVNASGDVFYDTNVLKVQKDGKYGLINYSGKELLECSYDSIIPLKKVSNSFVTEKDGKKGLIDNSGNVIINNIYEDITSLTNKYEDGYIVKNDSGKYGLINYSKKEVLECKYSEIKNVCGSNMYVVKDGQDLELITADGTIKLKNKFEETVSIDNSNLIVKSGDKYGVISANGDVLIPEDYQYMEYIYDGNYIAKKDNKYGIINLSGDTKVEFTYECIYYMSEEGFLECEKDDISTDLMDNTFTVKANGIVSEINKKSGYIKVRTNGEYKYYNYKLEEKTITDVLPSNTLFLSKKDNKYGFVNKNGVVIVDYKYDDATEQNEYGFAGIKENGKWGAIDSVGTVIIEPTYELKENPVVSFLNKWHLAPDVNANYYTDEKE